MTFNHSDGRVGGGGMILGAMSLILEVNLCLFLGSGIAMVVVDSVIDFHILAKIEHQLDKLP